MVNTLWEHVLELCFQLKHLRIQFLNVFLYTMKSLNIDLVSYPVHVKAKKLVKNGWILGGWNLLFLLLLQSCVQPNELSSLRIQNCDLLIQGEWHSVESHVIGNVCVFLNELVSF